MSKIKHFGGFTGTGRHRLQVQHDGPWDQMRILFAKRHADEARETVPEPQSTDLDAIH